ncbi:hypothetical protein GOODEAATRI_026949, partial [Goodea atripinnis]
FIQETAGSWASSLKSDMEKPVDRAGPRLAEAVSSLSFRALIPALMFHDCSKLG